jgi:hypothetical protein
MNLCQDCEDAFDERAAILEYDGELSRAVAERMALAELYRRGCSCRRSNLRRNNPDQHEQPEQPRAQEQK